jgi:hypothetical protein
MTEGEGSIQSLKNVYYVPDLKYNLISISQLDRLGYSIRFSNRKAYVNIDGKDIIIASLLSENNLYAINNKFFNIDWHLQINSSSDITLFSEAKEALKSLWHYRLGHINNNYIRIAKRLNLISGIDSYPLDEIANDPFCDACALSKSSITSSTKTAGSSHHTPKQLTPTNILKIILHKYTKLQGHKIHSHRSTTPIASPRL